MQKTRRGTGVQKPELVVFRDADAPETIEKAGLSTDTCPVL
jgi:hypothetical protein